VLVALVAPKIMERPDEARLIGAKQDLSTINQALKLYKLDNYMYPTSEQGLKALLEKPTIEPIPKNWKTGGYLDFLPIDPWGNEFVYLYPGRRREIDIYSYGADGRPGGEGIYADVWFGER
ncbi:MAG: type II secretion system major pseudopilin GspG, partial [Nitrospinota bacterium]|nr:type II secretion system major pseudopilin GspG [Nitrospinota bacterium]